MRRRLWLVPAVLMLVPSGCTRGSTVAGAHHFEIGTEEGIPAAVTTGGPRYEEELFTYELALTLTSEEAIPESFLQRPREFVRGPEGSYYVVDGDRIAVFDGNGRYRRSIGQSGQGPGDLMSPRYLRVHGDTLTVDSHLGNWRITRYATSGELLTTRSQAVATITVIPMFFLPADGGIVIEHGAFLDDGGYRYSTGELVVLDAAGDTTAVIAQPRVPLDRLFPVTVGDRTQSVPVSNRYASASVGAYSPIHGLFTADGSAGVIRFFDRSGRPRRLIRLAIPPERVSESEADRIRSSLAERLDEARTRGNAYGIERANLEVREFRAPEKKAFWRWVVADDFGFFWLDKPREGDAGDGPGVTYRLLSPDGEYLGDTTRPALRYSRVQDGDLMGILEDPETGELIPVVYRMRPIPKGFRYP